MAPRGRRAPPRVAVPCVLLEVAQLPECVLAEGAAVRLGPGVNAQVLGQVAGVGKGLGAVRTLVGLALSVVSNEEHQNGEGETQRNSESF